MTKILHIAETDKAGAGIAMMRYHDALVDAGYDSKLLVQEIKMKNKKLHQYAVKFPEGLLKLFSRFLLIKIYIKIKSYFVKLNYEMISFPWGYNLLANDKLFNEADVICIHWQSSFIEYISFFKKLKDKRFIFFLHDENHYLGIFHYQYDLQQNESLRGIENYVANFKKRILEHNDITLISNSNWTRLQALKSTVFKGIDKSYTLYYPFKVDEFLELSKGEARRGLQMVDADIYIGFTADKIHNIRKGFVDIIAIIDKLPANKSIALILMGHVDFQFTNEKVTVYDFGYIDDNSKKSMLYAAMDVFLFPSKAEAFGQVAVEAMLCGTPVIGNAVGGIPEIIKPGLNGYLFSPASFVKETIELINDHERFDIFKSLSSKTRNSVMDMVSIEHFIKGFSDIVPN